MGGDRVVRPMGGFGGHPARARCSSRASRRASSARCNGDVVSIDGTQYLCAVPNPPARLSNRPMEEGAGGSGKRERHDAA